MSSSPSEPEPGAPASEQPGGARTPADAPLDARQRAELDELRSRVRALEQARRPGERRHRMRSAGSAVLITVASVLALLAVIAVWVSDEVTDTDRYVATVAPLASN